jgi:hypothetical protein
MLQRKLRVHVSQQSKKSVDYTDRISKKISEKEMGSGKKDCKLKGKILTSTIIHPSYFLFCNQASLLHLNNYRLGVIYNNIIHSYINVFIVEHFSRSKNVSVVT